MRLIIAFALCLVSVGIVNAQLKPPADAESFHWREFSREAGIQLAQGTGEDDRDARQPGQDLC
jgi:hypothetical protein